MEMGFIAVKLKESQKCKSFEGRLRVGLQTGRWNLGIRAVSRVEDLLGGWGWGKLGGSQEALS